ncbi:MAG: pyrroline-5-carboxylate reductase family protein [Bdellovibrionales bacterium]
MYNVARFKISFLGCGQMAQSLIQAYLQYGKVDPKNILISSRNLQKTQRIAEKFQVQKVNDNEELLEKSSVIFLCVKPLDAEEVLHALRSDLRSNHTVISVMASVSIEQLQKWGLSSQRIIRLMPNIAVRVGRGVLPFYAYKNKESLKAFAEELFKPLGCVFPVDQEDLLKAFTVASASGIGFFLEILEYWIEWLQEQGFSYEQARQISVQTFLGAGLLADQNPQKKILDLQKEVTSSKGVTAAGLHTIRELELERILRLGFEKASFREKELSHLIKPIK